MGTGEFFTLIYLLGLGAGWMIAGAFYLAGKYKSPFFFTDDRQPLFFKMGIGFGAIYFSLGIAVLAYVSFPHSYLATYNGSSILLWLAILIPIANVIWLKLGVKPSWVKWLELEHGDSISLLRKKAIAMGLRSWNVRVHNQEQLESWVNEVLNESRTETVTAKPYLPPRHLCPVREGGFEPGDKVIWERYDGQRFFGVVVKITPQNRIRIAYPEGGFTIVKPENVYHIE